MAEQEVVQNGRPPHSTPYVRYNGALYGIYRSYSHGWQPGTFVLCLNRKNSPVHSHGDCRMCLELGGSNLYEQRAADVRQLLAWTALQAFPLEFAASVLHSL